jgi:uncharacterized membrane protein
MVPPSRVLAFDWLRGIAVVVMIQTHALVLLKPEILKTAFYAHLARIDGLVAPSFIFSAGFALALVQVRVGRIGDRAARAAQAKKSLKRIGTVLGIATLINAIWFPLWRVPQLLFRIDILHCIALSLLLALPPLVWLARRPNVLRFGLLAVALLIFSTAPLLEHMTGLVGLFVNSKPGFLDATTVTTFPLFPWSGYVFLGASFGTTVAMMSSKDDLRRWLFLLIGLGATLWFFQDEIRALYPSHNFWVTNPANAAQRWTLVLTLVAALDAVETRWSSARQSPLGRWLSGLGVASLSAYFFHQMLLFQHHVGLFARFFRGRADWGLYWVLVAALVALTWACVRGWERWWPLLRAKCGVASGRRTTPQSP